MHAKSDDLRAARYNFFDATRPFTTCDSDHRDRSPAPLEPTSHTTAMDEPKYSASLIRLWRIWRTTKEMMNERVRCACAVEEMQEPH
jgi:hypothetical protein